MNLAKFLNNPKVVPYIFISPFYIVWAVFGAFPMGYSIWLSFQRWESVGNYRFIGLRNFVNIFYRPETLSAYVNIVWYVVVIVIITTVIPLFLAALLNSKNLSMKSVFRAVFFLPHLASGVVVSILFIVLLDSGGLINSLLHVNIKWLTSTFWSKPSVAIAGTWAANGFWMVIYLGALQSVPHELHEAAIVDGARAVRRFRSITLPSISPVIFVNIIMATVWTMQLFDVPKVLTQGGPVNSSTTPVLELYNSAFMNFQLGYAAAFGWVLAVVIILIAILQLTISRKRGAM